MIPAVPDLALETWVQREKEGSRSRVAVALRHDTGREARVVMERCAAGRLRHAYPVAENDLEIRVPSGLSPDLLSGLLRELTAAVESADAACRRVVYAAPEGDLAAVGAAEDAGFRYVVDVDLPDGPVSLTVAEPAWVTAVDMDLDHVPQT